MAHHDFHVKNDDYPLVSIDDELMIVHRNQLVPSAVLYFGAHQDTIVEVRSALNRTAVEAAPGPAVGDPALGGTGIFIPAGGKVRLDLPGTGNPLDLVTKVSTLKGNVFVSLASFGEYDTYFKQVDVPSI
jgi:hypothetical protein